MYLYLEFLLSIPAIQLFFISFWHQRYFKLSSPELLSIHYRDCKSYLKWPYMQKVYFSDNFFIVFFICKEWASPFRRESENEKKKKLIKPKHLIHTWSDKAFKSSVVNLALSSLHKRSLEITFTVPLIPRVRYLSC